VNNGGQQWSERFPLKFVHEVWRIFFSGFSALCSKSLERPRLKILFGLAAEAPAAAIERLKDAGPAALTIGVAFGGAGAGLVSSWFVPHRLMVLRPAIPGLSLVVAPLATGFVMGFPGKQIRRSGHWPSSVATFRGGVVFAFLMALVRFLLIGAR
jgi:hypothetical protein